MHISTIINSKLYKCEVNPEFDVLTDICVVGMGTAGAMSVICAAKNGLKVVGVDSNNVMGGVATAASVWDYYYGSSGGEWEQINRDCFHMMYNGYAETKEKFDCKHNEGPSISSVVKSYILEQSAIKYDCKLYYNSTIVGVYKENDLVCGVQIFDGKRLLNIKSRFVIDGAEGFVARLAGCQFLSGRLSDNHTQLFSKTYGIYSDGYIRGVWRNKYYPESTDMFEYTHKVIKASLDYPGLLPEYTTNNRLVFEASMIGKREVYCVVTDDTYSLQEFVSGKAPANPVMFTCEPVDNSNPDIQLENELLQNWHLICHMNIYCLTIGIPMGAFIPKGMDGLLVVGKAIGVGHDMIATARMKSDIEKTGEVAAIMAVVSIKDNKPIREISYSKLCSILEKSGCYNPKLNIGLSTARETDKETGLWKTIDRPQKAFEYKAILSSDNPSIALWSAFSEGKEMIKPYLREWLNSSNKLLRENSAIALGLLKDKSCMCELRKIISGKRESYTHIYGSHKYIWYNSVTHCNFDKALVLLGRFKDGESISIIRKIAQENEQISGKIAREVLKQIMG